MRRTLELFASKTTGPRWSADGACIDQNCCFKNLEKAPMTLQLFAHPFSSYSQKVLVALYENHTGFDYRKLGPDDPAVGAEFAALWPIGRFPLLLDRDRIVAEATIIIEHLG